MYLRHFLKTNLGNLFDIYIEILTFEVNIYEGQAI